MLSPVAKLTDEQSSRALAWLNEKWPPMRRGCPVCGAANWNIQSSLMELREFEGGNLVIGGGSAIYPLLGVMCTNCGHMIFINAVVAGILDTPVPAEPKE